MFMLLYLILDFFLQGIVEWKDSIKKAILAFDVFNFSGSKVVVTAFTLLLLTGSFVFARKQNVIQISLSHQFILHALNPFISQNFRISKLTLDLQSFSQWPYQTAIDKLNLVPQALKTDEKT